jgi:hypothetical protein
VVSWGGRRGEVKWEKEDIPRAGLERLGVLRRRVVARVRWYGGYRCVTC